MRQSKQRLKTLFQIPMPTLLTIKQAAGLVGVTPKTIRRWESEGKIQATRTPGGHRRFNSEQLLQTIDMERLNLGYARVGSGKQQQELEKQVTILESYCEGIVGRWEIIQDVGTRPNSLKRGFLRLLDLLCHQKLERIVVCHRSRLLPLGSDLVFILCEIFHVEVVILNNPEVIDTEVEWEQDVEEIVGQLNSQLNIINHHKAPELKQQLQAGVLNLINR